MKNLRTFIIALCLVHSYYVSFAQDGQIHVERAPSDGVYIQNPAKDGIRVDSAAIGVNIRKSGVGLAILETLNNGIHINDPGGNGIFMKDVLKAGIYIDSTNNSGIRIRKVGEHGLYLSEIDANGIYMTKVKENGIYIKQAHRGIEISGVNEGIRMRDVGGNGATIESPFSHGVEIVGAGGHGVKVRNTEANGLDVSGAGSHGIEIQESGIDGVHIEGSGGDGIDIFDSGTLGLKIANAGSSGALIFNSTQTGVIINTTGTNGLSVLKAGANGMQVDSAAADGLVIDSPGDDGINIISPADDGITIVNSGNDGIHVNGALNHAGIFINSPSSTKSALLASHADDTKQDLKLGGDGLISADDDFVMQLDESDNIATATFKIKNSLGHVPFIVTEDGDLGITGHLSKGSGSFKIDHPLDPQNKYLYHSFVESPDMMNIYNGNAVIGADGYATIDMPEWFDALNKDFRYQLTPIGQPADLYVASEMQDRSFRIAGGTPGLKVSWQVTGIRQDKFADAHRIQVEVDKEPEKKGSYTHPELWPANTQSVSSRISQNLSGEQTNLSTKNSNHE